MDTAPSMASMMEPTEMNIISLYFLPVIKYSKKAPIPVTVNRIMETVKITTNISYGFW